MRKGLPWLEVVMLDSAYGRLSPRAESFLFPPRSYVESSSALLWGSAERDTESEVTGRMT